MAVIYLVVTGIYKVRIVRMLRQAKGCECETQKFEKVHSVKEPTLTSSAACCSCLLMMIKSHWSGQPGSTTMLPRQLSKLVTAFEYWLPQHRVQPASEYVSEKWLTVPSSSFVWMLERWCDGTGPQFLVQTSCWYSWSVVQVSSAATTKTDEIIKTGLDGTTRRFQTAQYGLGHNASSTPEEESTGKGLQALLSSLIRFRKMLGLEVGKRRMVGLVKKSLAHSTP